MNAIPILNVLTNTDINRILLTRDRWINLVVAILLQVTLCLSAYRHTSVDLISKSYGMGEVRTKPMKEASDKYQIVTNKLIALLEKGVKPWTKSWTSNGKSIFKNLVTGHCYTGINPILCLIDMLGLDSSEPYFVGFAQAKELGWKLQKGSKSTWLRWGGKFVVEDDEGKEQWAGAAKWLNVFHCSLFDDSEAKVKIADRIANYKVGKGGEINPDARIPEVEKFIDSTGARISFGGDRAFYTTTGDAIQMPEFGSFESASAYYATTIHEITHWTGHESRCNRDMTGSFGSKNYAHEELIAEIGAAFTCSDFGIDSEMDRHASYIDSWLERLKSDKKFFFEAAKEARKANQFLNELKVKEMPQLIAA